MFSNLKKIVFLSCALLLSFTAHANTQVYDKIVVFGDSLSDDGNLFKASGLPEEPYFDGRFSNGKLWIEMLAKLLHLDTSNKKQFADYAFGGAWAADAHDGIGGLVPLSFERGLYFNDTPAHSTDISNNLFVIWIGNNDYLQDGRLNEDKQKVTDVTIKFIKAHIDALIDSGAKHFLILNLPDLGQTPKAKSSIAQGHPEFAESISLLSKIHNQKLIRLIQEESSKNNGVEFISFDLASYLDDLISHPEKYNMKDVTTPCYSKGIGDYELPNLMNLRDTQQQQQQFEYCANTNDYLFWDYVHPTTYAHSLIAQFISEMLATSRA